MQRNITMQNYGDFMPFFERRQQILSIELPVDAVAATLWQRSESGRRQAGVDFYQQKKPVAQYPRG